MQQWYSQEAFQPYTIEREGAEAGAMLIHGFLGSPAETRPLATMLEQRGYDIAAPLIPGMAADFDNIGRVTARSWTDSLREEWDRFAKRYDRRLLIGYSLGGTLALHLAGTVPIPPDLMILLAPFVRIGDRRAAALPVAKHVLHEINFFENDDFSDPRIRDWYAKAMPGLDLDDPAVTYALHHEVGVPTGTIDRLRRLAGHVRRMAPDISVPAVIVQGHHDHVVLPADSRKLAGSLPKLLEYHEIPGDHMLPFSTFETWDDVQHLVDRAVTRYMPGRLATTAT